MKTAEIILSEETGETGIYLTKGQIRGSDAIDAMERYSKQNASLFFDWIKDNPDRFKPNKPSEMLYDEFFKYTGGRR